MKNDPETHPDFERVEELFQAAADRAHGERASFLDRRCAAEPELRAHLETLIEQLEREETLAAPAFGVSSAPPDAEDPVVIEEPGAIIDRYKLLEILGEGGFGVVYMAEQLQPVRRKVALKVIKPGMDTREIVARFEAERQALAMMDHPAIAKVLDGGTTASERPYFVMELVRGVPITDYCRSQRLALRDRLRLFAEVCRAVQYAHQKGIIHRDLKPSNVMVTILDGEPVPKVIDFGIAKAVATRLTEKTLFTRYHRFIGTPAYMSPEQAAISAVDVDTRTDVYSLGVLLYELLTGSTPFDTEALLQIGVAEVQRVLREVEPPRPSVRVGTTDVRWDGGPLGDAPLDDALPGASRAASVARSFRGDLDWIVMKALSKERDRRYGTATELAADIHRHLENRPVQAGPPSAAYRVRKFLIRHRAAALSAALIGIALFAGAIGTGLGFIEASRQRDLATLEAERAVAVTDFLVDTLALTDPEVALQPDLRKLLEQASARIEESFEGQPLAAARVRATIGRAYSSLGEDELAEAHLRRAAKLSEGGVAGAALVDAGELYFTLWTLTHVLFRLEREDAYATAQHAREVGLGHVGKSHPELAVALRRFYAAIFEGAPAADAAKVEEGLELLAAARKLADAALPSGDPLWPIVADTYQAAGMILWYSPLEPASEALHTAALEIRRRELPANDPETGKTLGFLVGVLNRAGKISEAEAAVREAIEILSAVGQKDYFQLAFARSMLGETLMLQGRYAEAEPLLLDGHRAILETVREETDWFALDSLGRVIALYDAWERPGAGVAYRQRLAGIVATYRWPIPWELARLAFGPTNRALLLHLDRLDALTGGGNYTASLGRAGDPGIVVVVDDLLPLYRLLAADQSDLAIVVARAMVAWANAITPGAADGVRRRLAEAAYTALEPRRESVPLDLADVMSQLSGHAFAAGDRGRASRLARGAWSLVHELFRSSHWLAAATRVRIARYLVEQGFLEEAEALLEPAHESLSRQLGKSHSDVRQAASLLVELYDRWGKPNLSERYRQGLDHPEDLATSS